MAKKWANPQYKVQMQVWTYNVTNPNEIMEGAKPSLSRKGPYTFRLVARMIYVRIYNSCLQTETAQGRYRVHESVHSQIHKHRDLHV